MTDEPHGAAAGRRLRVLGGAGCLVSLLLAAVGLILSVLGMGRATQEALPFGLATLLLGLVLMPAGGVALALGLGRRRRPAQSDGDPDAGQQPPSVIECSECGGSAPLSLATPAHTRCVYCKAEVQLPADLAERLAQGARRLADRTDAERQIAGLAATLITQRRACLGLYGALAAVLVAVALTAAGYGLLTRLHVGPWYAWLAGGLTSALATAILALVGGFALAAVTRGVVRQWAAIALPRDAGLGCRVCGGPLPTEAAPVLRCAYCSADNLASSRVMQLVAKGARAARAMLQGATEQHRRRQEGAALSLVALPVLTLLAWFAVGAASGTALISTVRGMELDPDPTAKYTPVRTRIHNREGLHTCLAVVTPRGSRHRVNIGGRSQRTVDDATLDALRVGPPVAATWLVGRQVQQSPRRSTTASAVTRTYRRPDQLAGHVATLEGTTLTLFLPRPNTGGQPVCLTGAPAVEGPSMYLR